MPKPKTLSQPPRVAVRKSEAKRQGRVIDLPSPLQIGVTPSDLHTAQEECPLCSRLAVLEQDHDHRTDLCRGRVCHSCNVLLGRFDRPVAEIRRFLDYLEFWEEAHAREGGQTYTAWMREQFPEYRKRGRRRSQQKGAA